MRTLDKVLSLDVSSRDRWSDGPPALCAALRKEVRLSSRQPHWSPVPGSSERPQPASRGGLSTTVSTAGPPVSRLQFQAQIR